MKTSNDKKSKKKKSMATILDLPRQKSSSIRGKKVLDRVQAIRSLMERNDPKVTEFLIKAISDRSPTVRAEAVGYLANLSKDDAYPYLIRCLNDSSGGVRQAAVRELGQVLVGQKYPPELRETLFDADELVRIEACETFQNIRDSSVLPDLFFLLKDPSPLVRRYSANAIGIIGTIDDIARLNEDLANEKSESALVGYYTALIHLGQVNVLEKLVDLLYSLDYKVRCATAHALSTIADEQIASYLISVLNQALEKEITRAAQSSIQSSLDEIKALL